MHWRFALAHRHATDSIGSRHRNRELNPAVADRSTNPLAGNSPQRISRGIISRMASTAAIQLPPLTKRSMTALLAKAKRMGMAPGDYAKRLIEDGLAIQREAEESSFTQIMEPVRNMAGTVNDAEIVELVESARAEHRAGSRRKKR